MMPDKREKGISMDKLNRRVNLVSIGISGEENQNLPVILNLLEQEGKEGVDLILLPEMALGYKIIRIDEIMKIIVIAAREDDEVYDIAAQRISNDEKN